MSHDIIALMSTVLMSGAVSGLVTTLLAPAATLGTGAAHFLVQEVDRIPASPLLRTAIHAELVALAGEADAAQLTVEGAATALLARVAPQFPQASYHDIIAVVGQFTYAFVAGLAVAPVPIDQPAPAAPAA